MDLKTRLKQLHEARAAGYLGDKEFNDLRAELLTALQAADFDPAALPDFPEFAGRQPAAATASLAAGQRVRPAEETSSYSPDLVMEKLQTGMEIGPPWHTFRLEQPLGGRPLGRVWLARELDSERVDPPRPLTIFSGRRDTLRALKFLAPWAKELAGLPAGEPGAFSSSQNMDPLRLRARLLRFRLRTNLAALLDHPHIVKVYGWRQGTDGWSFIEMEYLKGHDLRQRLQRSGAGLGWWQALAILRPVVAALDYAHHQHRMAHRGLKPENVFITQHRTVKVLDFGLACHPEVAPGERLRPPNADMRRPSPESGPAEEDNPLRQDLGALAALAYEIFSGQAPPGQRVIVEQSVHTGPTFRRVKPAEPISIAKPVSLTDTTWEILLADIYDDAVTVAGATEWLQRLEAAQGQPGDRRYWVAGGVAALLAVAAVGTGLLLRSGGREPAAGSAAVSAPAVAWNTADDSAFAAAQRLDTVNGYRVYLQRCPDCSHRPAAEAAIERLLQRETAIQELKVRFVAALETPALLGPNGDQNALALLKALEAVSPDDPFLTDGRWKLARAYSRLAQDSLNRGEYAEARARLAKGQGVLPGLQELINLTGTVDQMEERQARLRQAQLETQIETLKARFQVHLNAQSLLNGQGEMLALGVLKELEVVKPGDPFQTEGRRRLALAYRDLAQDSLNRREFAETRRRLKQGEAVLPGLPELADLARALAQAEAALRDAVAFARAKSANTRNAYQTYLDSCAPPCAHRQEAEAAVEQLQAESATSGKGGFRDMLASGGWGPELVTVPAGNFLMGSPRTEVGRDSEEMSHAAGVGRSFAIGRYEISFAEYDRFAEATGRSKPADEGWGPREQRPVIHVTWRDALAYAAWLSAQTGQRYRLPTETEWEYAARAGTVTARYWGGDPDQGCGYANGADRTGKTKFTGWTVMQCDDGYIQTAPVGLYRPNGFGLYDMLGNVLEWTCSAYDSEYGEAAARCANPATPAAVVARGGSWSDGPDNLRSASRLKLDPLFQDYYLGFRVVREL